MAQYLVFWPKAAVLMKLSASDNRYFYSRALPTNGFTEVVAQLEIDDKPAMDANTTITVTPQTSNDGVSWADGTAFSPVVDGTGMPVKDVLKITTVAAFMRFQIKFAQTAGSSLAAAGATLMITAAGRS